MSTRTMKELFYGFKSGFKRTPALSFHELKYTIKVSYRKSKNRRQKSTTQYDTLLKNTTKN